MEDHPRRAASIAATSIFLMRFGVSRTPIREALMQLSAIGLVEIRPRRGAVVVDPAPQRVYEMFEVMAELEGMPWHAFAQLTKEDAGAIAAFLQSLKPVSHQVPGPFKPGEKVPTFLFRILPPGETAAAAPK